MNATNHSALLPQSLLVKITPKAQCKNFMTKVCRMMTIIKHPWMMMNYSLLVLHCRWCHLVIHLTVFSLWWTTSLSSACTVVAMSGDPTALIQVLIQYDAPCFRAMGCIEQGCNKWWSSKYSVKGISYQKYAFQQAYRIVMKRCFFCEKFL